MTSGRIRCLLLFACLFGAERARGEWPFIRGTNFDGHSQETGLLDEWPKAGPPVLWTRELGQGYSAFIAWEDRIATQYQTLAGQFVVCLEADTGKTLWQYRYDWPHETAGVYPGPRATPTYAAGRIYFAAPNGLIGCLAADDGKLMWSRNPTVELQGRGTDFGYSCSPTVIDGRVFLPIGAPGASMIALDAADGTIVWQAGNDSASYTPAYPITLNERPCVLGYLQNALVCHDRSSGELIWRHVLSSGYDEHSAWPIYAAPYLWLSSPFKAGSELLQLTSDQDRPVRTIWKSTQMSNDIFSSVLVDGAIYGFDLHEAQAKTHRPSRGAFLCQDFMTGAKLWSVGDPQQRHVPAPNSNASEPRIGHATVLVADKKLITLSDTGELVLARVNRERYEELARVSLLSGEICWTQPTLHHGRLFVRNHNRAACVFLGEPSTLSPPALRRSITVADIPQREYVDLAAMILGIEPEYAFDIPSIDWLWNWFVISLVGVLGGSSVLALVVRSIFRTKIRHEAVRWVAWSSAFVTGALGTTYISHWQGDFVFTWPVCIFVTFQAAVAEVRSRNTMPAGAISRLRSGSAAALLLVSCTIYFLLCRRLSLVFEWVFLCGFVVALPFSLAGSHWFRRQRGQAIWEFLMTAAAFTSFYWGGAAILMLKS